MIEPVIVTNINCSIGENPLWYPREKSLYWLDIPVGIIYKYNPKRGIVEKVFEGDTVVGGFTIQENGSLLLFMEKGAVKIWQDNKLINLIDYTPILKNTRFNDVITDPFGRVFCGTMPDENGVAYLFLLDTDGELKLILDNIGLSNGMGFSPDKKKMYFTDSKKSEIYIFDYNKENGSLGNQKVFIKVEERGIDPDGLTVDSDGYVWSAQWNDGCLKRYSPIGKEVLRVNLPTKKITSLTFGGESYQDIYITSAVGEEGDQSKENEAGALFYLKSSGYVGLPEYMSKVCI
jgi:D-xylono/L-arabinono-1,4-lactonase